VNIVRRYWFLIVMLACLLGLNMIVPELGHRASFKTGDTLKQIVLVLPPIFILLGLLDTWVPKQIIIKLIGEESGLKGVLLSFVLGSAAAGPLYAAFPVVGVLMAKGAKFSNILIFVGAWSTTKIPMLLFEATALGIKFALTRLILDIPGILIMAYILSVISKPDEIRKIYNARLTNCS